MKLMVAVPTLDYIHYEFAKCLTNLTRKLERDGIDFTVYWNGGTLVYKSRETLASEAVSQGYTHVLWLDADMVFDDDLFDRLYRHGRHIVTGVYHGRRLPYGSCIFTTLHPPMRVMQYPHELFAVEGCGFGCVLTSTECLAKVYRKYKMAFQPSEDFGEDLSFCERALACGYQVFCDPEIMCGHIAQTVIYPHRKGKKNDES